METKHIIFIVLGILGFLILVVGGCVVGGVFFIKSQVDTLGKAVNAGNAEDAVAACNENKGIGNEMCVFLVTTVYMNDTRYKDAKLCDELTTDEYWFGCKVAYAGYWEDESICAEIAPPDGNLICLAAARKDPALCGQASTAELRESCTEIVNEDFNGVKPNP